MLILMTFVTTLTLAGSADGDLARILKGVQRTYQQGGDLSAEFTQTYIEQMRGKKRTETGRLWAKPDGRLRWQYLTPQRKDFYFDGTTASFYEPQKSQVTVFSDFANSPFSNALGFLIGQGNIVAVFGVAPCTTLCAIAEPMHVAIELIPKKPLAAIDHILVVVHTKTQRIQRSVIFDALGNRTEYLFRNITFHANNPDKRFVFKKPPGIQEQRASVAPSTGTTQP